MILIRVSDRCCDTGLYVFKRDSCLEAKRWTVLAQMVGYPSSNNMSLLLSWIVCVVAVVAVAEHSAILLLTIISKTLRRKPFVVSILLLSMSDLLLSLGLFLVSCIHLAALRQIWICGLSYFLQQLGLVLSLVHTLCICTERYLCTRPIHMETFSVRKRQTLAVISTLICSMILGIPYIFTVRSATVLLCNAVNLFQENKSYALAPARSIILLIWICTVIIYALTIKNFRRALRRTDRLRGRYSRQDNRFRASEMHHGNTSLPCSSTGKTNIGTKVDVSVKPKMQKWYSNDHLNENNTNALNDIIVKSDFGSHGALSKSKCTAQAGEPDFGQNIRYVTRGEAKREITTDMDGIGNQSVEHDTEIFPSKSINTESSSRSVNLWRQIKSRSSPPLPELKAFRIVSVVFIVFIVTMTPQSVVGFVMIVYPFSQAVEWFCNVLAISSILTNPIMHAFLLEDFRKILRCK
ncbi:uncharacterized protein [Argopecten irradians]|uniref:uncharacterized protein n=1 Tax=Argopecten irradians TaxID=31199 RepID=UPI0037229F93